MPGQTTPPTARCTGAGLTDALGEGGGQRGLQGFGVVLLLPQGSPDADHEQVEHQGERQSDDDCSHLQGVDAVQGQHDQGQGTDDDRPGDAQPAGAVGGGVLGLGGEVGQHQGAGVGGGHIEEHAHHDGYTDHKGGSRVLGDQGEEAGAVAVHGVIQAEPTVHDLTDGGIAEEGDPQRVEGEGHQQHADDELAQRAAAGDAGQEEAHEECPGHPPGPEEDGPPFEPAFVHDGPLGLIGEGLHEHAGEAGEEVAHVLDQCVEQLDSVAGDQHVEHQQNRSEDVELGQAADALLHTGDRRDGHHDHGQDDQCGLDGESHGPTEHDVQAVGEEDHADAEAGGDAEDGAQHGGDLDGVARGSAGSLADDRVESAADAQGQVVAVGEEAEGHAGQSVHGPAGDAVVEHRPQGGLLGGGQGLRLDVHAGADEVVGGRADHGEEHQVHADAGGEEHGGPGEEAELRLGVIGAELGLAHAGAGHHQDEDHDDRGGEDEVPAQAGAEPVEGGLKGVVRGLRLEGRPEGEQDDGRGRDDEDRPVDLGDAWGAPAVRHLGSVSLRRLRVIRGGCHEVVFPSSVS